MYEGVIGIECRARIGVEEIRSLCKYRRRGVIAILWGNDQFMVIGRWLCACYRFVGRQVVTTQTGFCLRTNGVEDDGADDKRCYQEQPCDENDWIAAPTP